MVETGQSKDGQNPWGRAVGQSTAPRDLSDASTIAPRFPHPGHYQWAATGKMPDSTPSADGTEYQSLAVDSFQRRCLHAQTPGEHERHQWMGDQIWYQGHFQ